MELPDTEDKTSQNPPMPTRQRPRLNLGCSRVFLKALNSVVKEQGPSFQVTDLPFQSGDLPPANISNVKKEELNTSKRDITRAFSNPTSNYENGMHGEKPHKNSKPYYSRSYSEKCPTKEFSTRNNNKKLPNQNNTFCRSGAVEAQNYKDSENYRGFNNKSHQNTYTKRFSTGGKNEGFKWQSCAGNKHFDYRDLSQLSDTQQSKESKNFCGSGIKSDQQDVFAKECNSNGLKKFNQKRRFSEENSHFNNSDYSQAVYLQEDKNSDPFLKYDTKNNQKDTFYKEDVVRSKCSFQKSQISRGDKSFSGNKHSQVSDAQQHKETEKFSKYGIKSDKQNYFTRETSTKPKNNYQEKQIWGENGHSNDHNEDLNTVQDEESANCIEFYKAFHQRNIVETEGVGSGFKISLQNTELFESSASTLSPSCDTQSSDILEEIVDIESDPEYLNKNKEFFQHSAVDFIPPPQPPKEICNELNISSSSVSSINSSGMLTTNEVTQECSPETPYKSETSDSVCHDLDSEQLIAINEYILGIVKEKSVSNTLSDRVVRDLNILFKNHLEGNVIDVYGSYYSNLAISTSDINLIMTADVSVRKSFMREVHKVLSKELDKYNVHPFEEADSTSQTKIHFSEPNSGISCQLVYLGRQGKNVMNMCKFLRNVGNIDSRIRTLLIATKIWAEVFMINEVEEGKLHPVGFAILVIHFLQKHDLLPIYSSENHAFESPPPPNHSSVGELWMDFLKYYSTTFNWNQDVVTINTKECVSKKSKDWGTFWIAIEDPFSGKNIAESVINSDTAEYIKACFKAIYEYFCSPPESSTSSESSDENSMSNEDSCKWQYSFQHCTVDNSDAFCEMCDDIDDICDECQKKIYTPPMPSLPQMTDSFLTLINKSLFFINDKYMLTDDEIEERKQFVRNLQKDVCAVYPGAQLELFGSSTNGFGFKNSDLDICITFKNKEIKNATAVLRNLRTLLRRKKDFTSVIAIFQAQIPIIKFHFEPKGWRGDISLNNTLAVHNSKLLYTYSQIDERCKMLGCALKLLAKKALISEVTDKALSSYSYLLMVIHFLQQRDPPILPVLQDPQLHRKDYKPDIVEGCNVWFCKDLDFVGKVNEKKYEYKNETAVEQLWLDLLDYYCSFDSNKFVTVRQKEPLFQSEKQHSSRLFNIQDPFIDTKNLGNVVSHKKAQETENVFRRARCLFRTPVKELPTSVKDIEDYFFSTMSLTGRIHKEAHCDLCGKFGHEKKDCKQSHFPIRRNTFRRYPIRNTNKKFNPLQRKPMNYQSERY